MTLTDRELATVLASLRFYQTTGGAPLCEGIDDIASCGGTLEPLAMEDIDGLCEKLNAASPDMLAVLQAIAGCPQAAPWLARLPFGDTNTWDAMNAVIAKATGEARS